VSFVVKGFAFSDPRSSALISGKLLLFPITCGEVWDFCAKLAVLDLF
jgi:hypothetical protein